MTTLTTIKTAEEMTRKRLRMMMKKMTKNMTKKMRKRMTKKMMRKKTRMLMVITSSEPVGATILIQLGTCPDRFVSTADHNEDGDDDDDGHANGHNDDDENNDGYLAGEMVDLVCVLALRELPIEQRHVFVWLILQHLCICVFTYLCVCVFVYFVMCCISR